MRQRSHLSSKRLLRVQRGRHRASAEMLLGFSLHTPRGVCVRFNLPMIV